MRGAAILSAALLSAAAVAGAHDVPLLPSTCSCDPIRLASTDGSHVVEMAAETSDARLRVVFDVAAKTAQVQAHDVAPRAFTLDGLAGTLRFPVATPATVSSDGDLAFAGPGLGPGAWFEVAVGEGSAAVPVALTTGLVVLDDGTVSAGTPLGVDGSVALVGRIPAGALPPPLDASEATLELACRLSPAPDRDRFRTAPRLERLRGGLVSDGGRLRGEIVLGGSTQLAMGPVVVRVAIGGVVVATLVGPVPTPDGRRGFAATASGGRVALARHGRRGRERWTVDVRLEQPVAPDAGPLAITLSVGDIIVRGDAEAVRRGVRLVVR